MAESDAERDIERDSPVGRAPPLDPRRGDVEDDSSSPRQRSLFAIAGSLLSEISLPKLLFAWTLSILVPAIALGVAPLLVTAWIKKFSGSISALAGPGTVLVLLVVIVVGWNGWRPLLRAAEANFWSLNALAVQPVYVLCREALRHLAEHGLGQYSRTSGLVRLRAASSIGAGLIVCVLAIVIACLVWPATRWVGAMADLVFVHKLIMPTIANAVVLVSGYLAVASLAWGFADAGMEQPGDLSVFTPLPDGARVWRVVHLSDIHVVGERYGFRIESGRGGPRGNDRLERVLKRIEDIHLVEPVDLIIVTGDVTDAGRSTEWAEFLDIVERHPVVAKKLVVLPGNHDVNIVDRANPARLDLPFSPGKRLRQIRALSAIASMQGERVHVVDQETGRLGATLDDALAPHRRNMEDFANTGRLRLFSEMGRVWNDQFPMILPPDGDDGLGVVILNSSAETHFSFTNALGLVTAEQAKRAMEATSQFPNARWIIGLHHHLMEYPMRVAAFSERIGTALINGSWFARKLKPLSGRAIIMHGHRHIDWIGACGGLQIVSAPSPIMGVGDGDPTHFHIHTLAATTGGQLQLLAPQRVDIAGSTSVDATIMPRA